MMKQPVPILCEVFRHEDASQQQKAFSDLLTQFLHRQWKESPAPPPFP